MTAMCKWIGFWTGAIWLLHGAAAFAMPPATNGQPGGQVGGQAVDATAFESEFRPLLTRYCVTCHSGEKPKGNLRLDKLPPDFADAASRKHWAAVIVRLQAGDMPPENKPRPQQHEVKS